MYIYMLLLFYGDRQTNIIFLGGGVKERETKAKKGKKKKRERQTDRQTERQTERQTDRQRPTDRDKSR